MPRQANIAVIDTNNTRETLEATAAETPEIFAAIPPALEEAGKDHRYSENSDLINDGMPEISHNMLEIQGLIHAPLLCEAVSLKWGDKAQEKSLRAQRVSALRARWSGRSFNALPLLPSLHVTDTGQYSTDPNTGECKTQ